MSWARREVGVGDFATASGGAKPVAGEIRDNLREAFVAAVGAALSEMAGAEAVVREVFPKAPDEPLGGISAVLELQSTRTGSLVLTFPDPTASALASRILTGVTGVVDAGLIRDCVGEIANVVAGQAKAMLAGTAFHFTFAVPKVVVGDGPELRPKQGQECLGISFASVLGGFTLRLCWNP
jgi:chemotaxis protein CheX